MARKSFTCAAYYILRMDYMNGTEASVSTKVTRVIRVIRFTKVY